MPPALILASSSRYRRELLQRLRLPFRAIAPDLDESPLPGEAPEALARRLSLAKARALATGNPGTWVIGSDQVPSLGDAVLGKPGTRERAREQLAAFSGRTVVFHTGVALVRDGEQHQALDQTRVLFRHLPADAIERYLDAEPAWDCAGSFKCEGLGISLFDAIDSRDPTALVGLPMIALSRLLRAAGFALP